jgi:hypothetical protein
MADVRLAFYDLETDALPDLCMKCGAPAVVRPIREFAYWFRRARMATPFCQRHKNYWTSRVLVGCGGGALLGVLMASGLITLVATQNPQNEGTYVAGVGQVVAAVCIATGVLSFLAHLIAAAVLAYKQIDVVEIAGETILLKNVSPEFATAYREQARGVVNPDVENIAREQFGRRADRGGSDDKYRRG